MGDMPKDKSTDTQIGGSRAALRMGAIVLGALAAGAIAGVVVLYGKGDLNVQQLQALTGAETAIVANAATSCEGTGEMAGVINPFIQGDMAAVRASTEPLNLSDLAFQAPDGSPTTLADFAGKTVLVNLWATWCAPCRAEMPALGQLQTDLKSERFEVVTINIDTRGLDRPKAFLQEIGVDNLPLYADPSTDVFNTLKNRGLAFGMPTTLLIDQSGCTIAHLSGPAHWDSPDAQKLIEATISKQDSVAGS